MNNMKFKNKVSRKIIYVLFVYCFLLFSFNIYAKKQPPLAPSSPLSFSAKEMILQFKLFILVDIFRTITDKKHDQHDFFILTDLELNTFLAESMQESAILSNTANLKAYFLNHKLYIKIEDSFFRCIQLEVLPGQFDFKIETLSAEQFLE